MKKEALSYGIIGFLLGLITASLFASFAVNNNVSGMMRMMGVRENSFGNNQTVVQRGMQNIDRHFIEQMIPHHEDAITMANVALEKGQREEIKDLAKTIKQTQSEEILLMEQWYQEWFGRAVPENSVVMNRHGMRGAGMHMGMMGNETDIEALREAADFDRAFIEEMIPHHQMAIMMANMLVASTNRPEMKKLAEDIIAAQTKEVNDMRAWTQAWDNEK